MKTQTTVELSPAEIKEIIREAVREEVLILREDPLLTRAEAAKLIGKSVQTIARMERKGNLVPEYGAGEGHPRYYKSHLLRFKYK